MSRRPSRRTWTIVLLAGVAAALLVGCAPETGPAPSSGDTPTPGSSASGSSASPPSPTGSAGATPSASPTTPPGAVGLPTDCRAILSQSVLAELGSTPLNDPAFSPSGVQPDGSLICVWRDPGADTTGLITTISRMDRGPALDMLNVLADDEGFTCYTPDGGTRCEKSFPNPQYPVTDGRTLFWREDVLIDTQWSNLAPDGYTDSIVNAIF